MIRFFSSYTAVQRKTVVDLSKLVKSKEPITVLTAYDYPSARLVDQAGIDVCLVGDSLGMTALGYTSTLPVTLDDMIHHSKAVMRGVKKSFVVCDLPFGSYESSPQQATQSSIRLIKETGVDVKIDFIFRR